MSFKVKKKSAQVCHVGSSIGKVMFCFQSVTTEMSQSKNKIRLMNFNDHNESFEASRVVHPIKGIAFSCTQVQNIVPF